MRRYIDVHAHIGDTINRVPACGQTADKYLARMADSDVVAAVLSPAAGGPQARGVADTRDQNEAVARACRQYPRRFPLGLAILEVRHQQAGVDEIARAMDAGLWGFMCHPAISGHALGDEMVPALELVNARGGVVLLHAMGRGTEKRIAGHARRFGNVTFIAAHVSMDPDQHRESIAALAGLDNVWVDFAQHPATDDESWDIAHIVEGFGADRVLFGGDTPYYDFRHLRDRVEQSGLNEATKDRIAKMNATDLIRRFVPEWEPDLQPAQSEFPGSVDLWATLPGQRFRLR